MRETLKRGNFILAWTRTIESDGNGRRLQISSYQLSLMGTTVACELSEKRERRRNRWALGIMLNGTGIGME